MPDLPVRFNPARIIEYKKRLFPGSSDGSERAAAVGILEEEPTPWFAFVCLLLFVFFSYAQLGAWLPGHPPPGLGGSPTGLALLVAKIRLSFTPALLALVGIIVYKSSRGQTLLFTNPQTFLLALFIGCAFVSVPFSVYPTMSFEFARSNMLKLFFLFVVTTNVIRNTRSFKIFLWSVVLAGCFPAIGALLGNLFPDRFGFRLEHTDRIGWVGHYENPNLVAFAMCMLMPVALCLIELSTSLAKKAFICLLIALYGFVMLKMLSRASMVSVVIIAFIYILTSKKKIRNLFIAAVLGVAAVAAVPGVVSRAQTMTDISQDASAMGRLHLWKEGLKMGADRPLWGVGVNCFNVATAERFSRYSQQKSLRWMSPHNSFIEVFGELGAPGLLVFLTLVGVSIADAKRLHKKLEKLPDPGARELARLSKSVFLCLMAISLIGMTGHHAYDWSLHMFIALTVCLKQMAWRYDVRI